MPDLGKTDAQWSRLGNRELFSCGLSPIRELREVADKFSRERTQIRFHRDISGFIDETVGATISGADPGVNCGADARVDVRITDAGGGDYTVTWYNGTGGSAAIAAGTAAAGATVTLTAQNSSGVTGTWELPGSVSTTSDDELWFEAVVDYRKRLPSVFTLVDGIEDDAASRAVFDAAYLQVSNTINAAKEQFKAALSRFAITDGEANPIARMNEFLSSNQTSMIQDSSQSDDDGNVTRLRTGIWPRMSSGMAGETTGSEQFVVKNTVSAAAGVFDGDNDGLGAVASHTPGQACPPIVATFTCIEGANTGAIGAEQFSVEYAYTKDGDERRRNPGSVLTIEQSYTGILEFGPITLTRTLTKTGDDSNNIFTAASNATVTGPTNANTDDGVLHWETTGSGPYTISFYTSASLATNTLVAQAVGIASGAAFSATSQNSSGLQVDWQLGGTESATSGTLNLNPFRTQRAADKQPDQFTVTVSVAAGGGTAQTLISEEWPGASLNSATTGSETLLDEYVHQGTFAPFSVKDN